MVWRPGQGGAAGAGVDCWPGLPERRAPAAGPGPLHGRRRPAESARGLGVSATGQLQASGRGKGGSVGGVFLAHKLQPRPNLAHQSHPYDISEVLTGI